MNDIGKNASLQLSVFPLGIEIRRLPCHRPIGRPVSEFLKKLFEREELNDGLAQDGRMKAQTSYCTDRARCVHLHAETAN